MARKSRVASLHPPSPPPVVFSLPDHVYLLQDIRVPNLIGLCIIFCDQSYVFEIPGDEQEIMRR